MGQIFTRGCSRTGSVIRITHYTTPLSVFVLISHPHLGLHNGISSLEAKRPWPRINVCADKKDGGALLGPPLLLSGVLTLDPIIKGISPGIFFFLSISTIV